MAKLGNLWSVGVVSAELRGQGPGDRAVFGYQTGGNPSLVLIIPAGIPWQLNDYQTLYQTG